MPVKATKSCLVLGLDGHLLSAQITQILEIGNGLILVIQLSISLHFLLILFSFIPFSFLIAPIGLYAVIYYRFFSFGQEVSDW